MYVCCRPMRNLYLGQWRPNNISPPTICQVLFDDPHHHWIADVEWLPLFLFLFSEAMYVLSSMLPLNEAWHPRIISSCRNSILSMPSPRGLEFLASPATSLVIRYVHVSLVTFTSSMYYLYGTTTIMHFSILYYTHSEALYLAECNFWRPVWHCNPVLTSIPMRDITQWY